MWNVQCETGIEPVDFDRDVSIWEEVSIEKTLFCAEENCDEFVINTIHQTKIEDDISLAKENNWSVGKNKAYMRKSRIWASLVLPQDGF